MDRFRRRWPWLDFVLTVNDRFGEVNGGFVAAAVTLSVFLSIFPLILVGIAVFGYVVDTQRFTSEIIDTLGLTGSAARTMRDIVETAQQSRRGASIVGFLGLVWSALGVANAIEYAFNAAWQVKGRGIKDKGVAVLWMVSAGLIFLGSIALGAALNVLPGWATPFSVLVGVAVNTALFWWSAKLLTNVGVGWRPLLPGAIAAGVAFEVLKAVGTLLIPRAVSSSSALYGSIGTIFALITWLFLLGRILVYSSVLNVVLHERKVGTATMEIETPKVPGETPTAGDRGGAVKETASVS
ncbi:MAG TPA: YihY/virulence factor BrkB family protein [Acidimicrobiales bacterium]|jgi:membrane protein